MEMEWFIDLQHLVCCIDWDERLELKCHLRQKSNNSFSRLKCKTSYSPKSNQRSTSSSTLCSLLSLICCYAPAYSLSGSRWQHCFLHIPWLHISLCLLIIFEQMSQDTYSVSYGNFIPESVVTQSALLLVLRNDPYSPDAVFIFLYRCCKPSVWVH